MTKQRLFSLGLTAIVLSVAGKAQPIPAPASTFVGGPGDQKGAAVGVQGGAVYVTGNQAGGMLTSRFSLNPGAPIWTNLYSAPSSTSRAVAATPTFALAFGSILPGTCPGAVDGVGDTEAKIFVNRVSTNGASAGCTGSPAFSYKGYEGIHGVTEANDGTGALFAGGFGENCGFGHTLIVLEKRDGNGNLVLRVTEPNTDFTRFDCQGYSDVLGLATLNGSVYAAGSSKLTSESGAIAPMIMRYDTNLQRVWKQRSSEYAGNLNAVAGFEGSVFAVGAVNGASGVKEQLIEKYSEAGTRQWSLTAGPGQLLGVASVGCRLFAVGHNGNGSTRDAVIREIDPDSGAILQTLAFGGSLDDAATGVAATRRTLYVVGESNSFATPEGNPVGSYDTALWSFDIKRRVGAALNCN
ncbi:MAG: hypothetical protein ACKV2U_22770 [Bryobacteraceae bacterium]